MNAWRLLGLDLAPGTITDGLRRLEILLRPIYEVLKQRNSQGDLHQGDETRWPVFVPREGKEGHGWWLWVVKGLDTVIYLLDPSRGHTVVENHFGAQSRGVLVVDRYAAYQAMIWVKDGVIVLAFCWSHVRRDFIRVGKGWPELKTWALEWLRRIRLLYRLNDRRLAVQQDATAFGEADGCLRQAVAAMKTEMETELARADLATPCRKALESLRAHWEGLRRFVDDPRIPMVTGVLDVSPYFSVKRAKPGSLGRVLKRVGRMFTSELTYLPVTPGNQPVGLPRQSRKEGN